MRGTVTYTSLCEVIDHIRESAWPADLIAVTGDLIQDHSREAYDRFCQMLEPLSVPVHCIPGNHDVREIMQSVLTSEPFSYCAQKVIGNWLLVGIDSCIPGQAGGRIDKAVAARFAKTLAESSAPHVMVCLHHPPLPVGSRWLDQVGLENSDEFLRLISEAGNVRLAIFGHVHQEFAGQSGNTQIIGTPSTCRQFKVGSDEFALDELPPAYRRIELHADGRVETEVKWLSGRS